MKQELTHCSVVILAAGASKRFGSNKQLADFGGDPLLITMIKKVLLCGLTPTISLGANLQQIIEHPSFQPFKAQVIKVKHWQSGQAESIKESVRFFDRQQSKGIVFLLADQPLIDLDYLKRFFREVAEYPASLICTEYAGDKASLGTPAYFPKEYFEQLLHLEGDVGAKQILLQHNPHSLKYKGELLDIDEPADLARAKEILKQRG